MNKTAGFNLLELLISIAISAVLIMLISTSFARFYAGFMANSEQLEVNQNLRFSLGLIKRDLQNAGVFGSFSFHNQAAASSYTFSHAALPACNLNHAWCYFESATVGVRSYLATTNLLTKVIPAGARLDPASDILRLQYGGDQVATLDASEQQLTCVSNNSCMIKQCYSDSQRYLSNLNFTNAKLDDQSSIYFLASSNHSYLLSFARPQLTATSKGWGLNFQLAAACPLAGQPWVRIESGLIALPDYNFISNDPDMSSMQLVNFYTRYYFVAKLHGVNGLYVATTQSNGQLSPAKLISTRVSQINFSYTVTSNATAQFLNQYPALEKRYAWCSTAAMNGLSSSLRSNTNCAAKWSAITSVHISLSATAPSPQHKISQTESASVGWLW